MPDVTEANPNPVAPLERQPTDHWLRLAYKLAWAQYAHEDELRHHKNTLYISIQTALFAILPATIAFMNRSPNQGSGGTTVDVASLVIGTLFIGTALFGFRINKYWENVIRSGRGWMYLRYATGRAIEHEVGLSEFGLAAMEHRWDNFCKQNNQLQRRLDERSYFPFAHIKALEDVSLYPKPPIGESHAALGIVRTLNIIWLVVGILGLAAIGYSFVSFFGVFHPPTPPVVPLATPKP